MPDLDFNKEKESDVVISSRVRLARNIKDYPFPFKMSKEQGTEIINKVRETVIKKGRGAEKFLFVDVQSLNPIERQAMVEMHLISPDLAEGKRESGIIISEDRKISIMINEEDHLRIQCIMPGMHIDNAWESCNKIDSLLEDKIEFAFDSNLGYLTCCPTNLGTGIRASVMLHLPALTMTGYIRNVLEACNKIGVAVRGLYGENSEASGNMFQISNQVTLGLGEEEIIKHITTITSQVIEQERTLRNELYKQNPFRFEDKIYRSLGVLANARIISTEESLKLLSDVRLGVDMGILKDISPNSLNEVMLLLQPGYLQKMSGKPLGADDRDIKRAELIRNNLNKQL